MVMRTTCEPGINWNWYTQAEYNDQDLTATLYFHDRRHKYEHEFHPIVDAQGEARLLADVPNNEVYGIRYNGKDYLVLNPKGIYDYRDITHIKTDYDRKD